MASDKEQTALKNKIISIKDWVNRDSTDLGKKDQVKILLQSLSNLEKMVEGGTEEMADAPQGEVDFADFLSDIGNSVVETQRKLDEQSRVYLEEIRPLNHITPAIYRIPKVSASIKFGMREIKQKGFNIIVAQQKQEDEKMLNQSLDFEIISRSAPTGLPAKVFPGRCHPLGSFFSKPVRDALFSDISAYEPKEEQKKLKKEIELLLEDQDKVLILQIGPRLKTAFDGYLLLYANDLADKNVGIWSLQRDPTGQEAPSWRVSYISLPTTAKVKAI